VLKRKLLPLAIVLTGIVLALWAWQGINKKVVDLQRTVKVPVAARNIDTYSKIAKEDLQETDVPRTTLDSYTAIKTEEIIGKIALAPLYQGKPIDRRSLTLPESGAGNFYVVGINVDPARTAGVSPGDMVDVYKLPQQAATNKKDALVPVLLADNVRVLKICDDKGVAINEIKDEKTESQGIGTAQQVVTKAATSAAPRRSAAIVYLAVRPEHVQAVIEGSQPKSTLLALAKRPE